MKETTTVAGDNTARWSTTTLRIGRSPSKFTAALTQVKPLFAEWLKADRLFTINTEALALRVRAAWEMYSAQPENGGRVGFARHFDPSIPADARTRDLADNRTYNRLNYLIDKVGKPPAAAGDDDTPAQRETAEVRRARLHQDWLRWRSKHKSGSVPVSEVEALVKVLLAELMPAERVEEVLAA